MRTLSGRIAFLLGTAAVLLLGGAAVLMDHLVDAEMRHRFDSDLEAQAHALAELVEHGPGGLDMGEASGVPLRMLASDVQGAYAVRCTDGSRLLSRPPPAGYPAHWVGTAGEAPVFADLDVRGTSLRAVWFRLKPVPDPMAGRMMQAGVSETTGPGRGDCQLIFMQSRTALDDILLTIDVILLAIPLLALLLVLLLSPHLVRRGLRPLAALCESMREVGPNLPGRRLRATGTHELEPLVTGFNDVLALMDDVVARERRFTDALAHEMRTRLAELHTLVDIERRYPSGRSLDALLGDIGDIGGELEGTISGLLLLTRLDAGLESPDWRPVDMDAFVSRLVERATGTAKRRDLRIAVERPELPLSLMADPSLLNIVVGNLLGNACEYAAAGSTIRLRWDGGSMVIENQAPDLREEDIGCFGQRFWGKQQGRDGHTGLGLALAGSAALAMGFPLSFDLREGQWLRVTLDWRQSLRSGTSVLPGSPPEASRG
jgi:signal transduction histidine kinase